MDKERVWAANERLKGNSFLVQWTLFLYGVSQEITVEQKVTYLIMLGNCTVWDIELAAFKMITGVTLYNDTCPFEIAKNHTALWIMHNPYLLGVCLHCSGFTVMQSDEIFVQRSVFIHIQRQDISPWEVSAQGVVELPKVIQ